VLLFTSFVLEFISRDGLDGLLDLMNGMGSEDR